ncbi:MULTISPECIES: hypothetical protein [Streptacidiphilus]|uniref:Uncharacterized protein n=1 Tax=Streptacidiphilus cavernicola TaxID=3342716 RepID=A0ABV6UTE9_9ACTN|nr:hypothetical protein [Streptacidiphilus jeojiense]
MPDVPRESLNFAATESLSSLAYRDGPLTGLTDSVESVSHKEGRHGLFVPTIGEAFCRAVVKRTTGKTRKPLVPSYGADPRRVVEHCLEAEKIRHERDRRLTGVAVVFGLLFLPGTLIWLAAFKIRDLSTPERRSLYGGVALTVAALLAVLLLLRPFASGWVGLYVRVMMLVPVLGWFVAFRICRRTADQLRLRWNEVLDGSGLGPVVPEIVPMGPQDTRAEELKKALELLEAEQETNVLQYAGTKGILGLGKRWGSWHMAEQIDPAEGIAEIRTFHPWDVLRRIEDRLREMSRSTMPAENGIPDMRVTHWMVMSIPEGADEISRPSNADMDGYRYRNSAMTSLANKQQFGRGPRHYLGTQFVLWGGQLVVTLLVTVTLLHHTLRVEVTGHALGPMAPMFNKKASRAEIQVPRPGRPWEERTKQLPIVAADEVVRLTLRAPFTWPWGEPILDWLGGTLKLPEPFGLRHAWAVRPWSDRFMADDALRVATPVLRTVHKATMEFLEDHDVEVERFGNRAGMLGGEVQGARASKADVYDAD